MRRIVLFVITLVVGATATALGFWQLNRLAGRRAANLRAIAGRDLPPLVVDAGRAEVLGPNRRAILHGMLDSTHEFLLRNRLVRGVPAVLVVTPLRLAGADTAVLINRGYVPAADAIDPGAVVWSEQTRRTWRGVLLPVPDRGDGEPLLHGARESWRTFDLRAMRGRVPYPLSNLYLVAEPDSAEGNAHTLNGRVYPFRTEPPPMGDGPHLAYAVQWFGIAAAVVAFGVIFVLRGGPRGTADRF